MTTTHSNKAPAIVLLPAYDLAVALRERSGPIVGGFQTPLEMECLEILLRGRVPVTIYPARAFDPARHRLYGWSLGAAVRWGSRVAGALVPPVVADEDTTALPRHLAIVIPTKEESAAQRYLGDTVAPASPGDSSQARNDGKRGRSHDILRDSHRRSTIWPVSSS